MAMTVLSALEYESHAFNAPHAPEPADLTVAASAVIAAAVVVELAPEARTGSRRSMMTDDSRPSHTLAT